VTELGYIIALIIISAVLLGTIIVGVVLLLNSRKNTAPDVERLKQDLVIELLKNQNEINAKTNEQIAVQLDHIRSNVDEQIGNLSSKNSNELGRVLDNLNNIQQKFTESEVKMTKTVSNEMVKINQSVESRLSSGFEQTNATFTNVIERLSKIDEAQKNIESLSKEVISLQDILRDKKMRGNFGEFQLKQMLVEIFGETSATFEVQKELSNRTRVDAIIHMPSPNGDVCVDSKFPLENFRRLQDSDLPDTEKKALDAKFRGDIKKHIDDISGKYIIKDETSDQAIMFIPSESVFYYIVAFMPEIVQYSNRKNIVMASPTTFVALLKVVQVVVDDYIRRQNTQKIIIELNKLNEDFGRYVNRWQAVKKNIDSMKKNADDLDTTNSKIVNRFNGIYRMEETKAIEVDEIEKIEQEG
jgi:DNA recombination protein RmuC